MPPTLRAGLTLGLAVAAWIFITGFTGWYKHPAVFFLFWLAIPLQIGILLWALRETAPGAGYGRQVWNGVSISLLGSMILFGASLLFTSRVFPHYFQDMEALGRQMMAKQGFSADQIEAAVRTRAPLQVPLAKAKADALVMVMTGFLTSIVAAAWLRKK